MEGDGKIYHVSLYYLSSGDQSSTIISHVFLRGENYLAWDREMQLALQLRRKFMFVNGSITQPYEKKKHLDWAIFNSMLVSWMLKSMEPKVAAPIPFHDNEKKLWDFWLRNMAL